MDQFHWQKIGSHFLELTEEIFAKIGARLGVKSHIFLKCGLHPRELEPSPCFSQTDADYLPRYLRIKTTMVSHKPNWKV